MGAFTAFLVALFAQTCGIPPTVYLLSGSLGLKIPAAEPPTPVGACGTT